MKTAMKIALIGLWGLIIGTLIGKASLRPVDRISNTLEFDAQTVKELKLVYHSEKIIISESDSDQIIIKEYTNKARKKNPSKVTEVNGIVEVMAYKPPAVGIYYGHTELYLPKSYQGVLKLENSSGRISCKTQLSLASLQAETHSGSIELSDIRAEEITLTAGSGKIDIERAKGDLEAEAGSGAINISNFSGSTRVETGSGKIWISCTEELNELDASAGSGSIKIKVPEKLAFHFYAQTGSGSIRTFFRDSMKKDGREYHAIVGQNAHSLIEASTNSGSITVKER